MSKTIPDLERESFGFKEKVLSEFEFLVRNYGYSCVQANPTFVRFESKKVFVNVYHGRSSYILGFEIGLLGDKIHGQELKITLDSILRAKDVSLGTKSIILQASTEPSLNKCVKQLAGVIRENITEELLGKDDALTELFTVQERISDNYLRDMDLGYLRNKVASAWAKKDFQEVIDLYQLMINDLNPLEIKRLEYAKKKVTMPQERL